MSFTQALIRSRIRVEVIGRQHAMGGASLGADGTARECQSGGQNEACQMCAYDGIFGAGLGSIEHSRVDVRPARCGSNLRKDKVLLGRGLQSMCVRDALLA